MIDTHTHTTFSHDGKGKMSEMIEKAISLGLTYYAITDHLDKDYLYCKAKYKLIRQLNDDKQYNAMLDMKAKYGSRIKIGLGIEAGYALPAINDVKRVLDKHDYDYIINSVHSVNGYDAYFAGYFKGKTKREAYYPYFENILASLDVPYRYETVAHIGYIARNATYADKDLRLNEYEDIIDKIFKRIIEKEKVLEFNTNVRLKAGKFIMPTLELMKRYYDLGGRLITIGSDAHYPERIAESYYEASKLLRDIGFTEVSYFYEGKRESEKI